MTLTVGSLFTGIGGLDLGLERAGMTVIWQSEIDPYCCRVLNKHWPHIPNLGDITAVDWSTVERPDVICGGYPCQPFSIAGRRKGDNDPRHLWPHVANAIRALQPRFALLENVTGHLALGFGDVLADLASSGYDAQWDCIPAAAVGAPHIRDRVFIIATCADMADTSRIIRWPRLCPSEQDTIRRPEPGDSSRHHHPWPAEPDVGRVADGIPHRMDRLRALGNAVVPQVAEHIGHILLKAAA